MHVSVCMPSLLGPLPGHPVQAAVSVHAAHIPQAQCPGHSGRMSLRGHTLTMVGDSLESRKKRILPPLAQNTPLLLLRPGLQRLDRMRQASLRFPCPP